MCVCVCPAESIVGCHLYSGSRGNRYVQNPLICPPGDREATSNTGFTAPTEEALKSNLPLSSRLWWKPSDTCGSFQLNETILPVLREPAEMLTHSTTNSEADWKDRITYNISQYLNIFCGSFSFQLSPSSHKPKPSIWSSLFQWHTQTHSHRMVSWKKGNVRFLGIDVEAGMRMTMRKHWGSDRKVTVAQSPA